MTDLKVMTQKEFNSYPSIFHTTKIKFFKRLTKKSSIEKRQKLMARYEETYNDGVYSHVAFSMFGYVEYPTADYSKIKNFPPCASFGDGSIFGDGSKFSPQSKFGNGCIFGNKNIFGKSRLLKWTASRDRVDSWGFDEFGYNCLFGDNTVFNSSVSFGMRYPNAYCSCVTGKNTVIQTNITIFGNMTFGENLLIKDGQLICYGNSNIEEVKTDNDFCPILRHERDTEHIVSAFKKKAAKKMEEVVEAKKVKFYFGDV